MTNTAAKTKKFQHQCLRDPAQVMEFVKTSLAHGATPGYLAKRWNAADPDFLIDAKLRRADAVSATIDNAIYEFMARDGVITPDVARFIRRIEKHAGKSQQSTRRLLEEINKQVSTIITMPSAWPLESERRAEKRVRQITQKSSIPGSGRPTYPGGQLRENRAPKPAENCASNSPFVSKTAFAGKAGTEDSIAIPAWLERRP